MRVIDVDPKKKPLEDDDEDWDEGDVEADDDEQ